MYDKSTRIDEGRKCVTVLAIKIKLRTVVWRRGKKRDPTNRLIYLSSSYEREEDGEVGVEVGQM